MFGGSSTWSAKSVAKKAKKITKLRVMPWSSQDSSGENILKCFAAKCIFYIVL